MLKPFFTYFGGKYRLAPRYPDPAYSAIFEPFAGSAGYSLRYPDRKVILCERDDRLRSMWEWLIRASGYEIRSLPLLEQGQSVDDLKVIPEAAVLIGFWCNKATAHPGNRLSAWARKYPEQFWGAEIRERVASQVGAIGHWRVYSDFRKVDGWGTWFIDPPYQSQGHRYREHDINYLELHDWCASRQGQVMVCEDSAATWGPFKPFHEAKSRLGKCSEVLWHFETRADPCAFGYE